MRILGERADGALAVEVASGAAVVLLKDRCSAVHDVTAVMNGYGPWKDVTGVSMSRRQQVAQQIDRTRQVPIEALSLGSFQGNQHTTGKKFKKDDTVIVVSPGHDAHGKRGTVTKSTSGGYHAVEVEGKHAGYFHESNLTADLPDPMAPVAEAQS